MSLRKHPIAHDCALPGVIPAKAGIQGPSICRSPWMPAFAGMTEEK